MTAGAGGGVTMGEVDDGAWKGSMATCSGSVLCVGTWEGVDDPFGGDAHTIVHNTSKNVAFEVHKNTYITTSILSKRLGKNSNILSPPPHP